MFIPMKRFLIALLFVAACFGDDRSGLSRAIEQRTGHGLNPQGKPDPKAAPSLPPGVSLAGPISEDDAAAVALWNNTALQAELAQIGLARADLLEAGLLRNPNLSLLLPVGAKPFELLLGLPVDALWQRPRRVAAARANFDAVAEALAENGLNLARDARIAHIDLALAVERLAVAKEREQLLAKIGELTEKRRKAGDASGLEVTLAQTEARAAADQAARFSRAVETTRERLRSVLGLRNDATPLAAAAAGTTPGAAPEWKELVEAALSSRPELRAAELRVDAAARHARLEHSQILALTVQLSSKEIGERGTLSGPGLGVELPLFHRRQGAISRAEAEVERAAWQYLALRDSIEHQVRRARLALVEASERLERIRAELLPAARQTIRLAEKAYAAGEISYLAVLESSRRIMEFRREEQEAAADLRRSAAELDRSVGRKL